MASAAGTGLVDARTARALEYLHNGDTAIVSQQHSCLPSWISVLVGPGAAGETSEALITAVNEWWSGLPADDRPLLVASGQSLGSLGTETALAGDDLEESIDRITGATDGLLITGPTFANPVWRQSVDGRTEDSPVWQPAVASPHVRAATGGAALSDDPDWAELRVAFVHHASDPVGLWNLGLLWSEPAWVHAPLGPVISPQVSWFPYVTWVQVLADLAAGLSTPAGHGHNYGNTPVHDWAAVLPPPGWTSADSERLARHLGS